MAVAAITLYAALQSGVRIRAPKPNQAKTQRAGLSQNQEDEKKRHLRTVCPSEGWVELHFSRHEDVSPDGITLIYTTFHRNAFPPNADAAPMCRCRRCSRLAERLERKGMIPHAGTYQLVPQDVHAGESVCIDHIPMRFNIAFGASPSARAIRELQHRNLRLEDVKLKSEQPSDLNREIRMYQEGRSPLAKSRLAKGRAL